MQAENSPPVGQERTPAVAGDEALRAQLEAAMVSCADAERRAEVLSDELAAISGGVGWRVLHSYRAVLGRVAPPGSRRAGAYDIVLGAARRRSTSAGSRPASQLVGPPQERAAVGAVVGDPSPAHAADVVGPPGANTWFRDHYDEAASRVVEFLAMDGIDLTGRVVADIGAGDGILDLGLVHKGGPRRLVAFDVNTMDRQDLLTAAVAEGVCDALPEALEFVVCGPTSIPAEDKSFDVVVTWSAFEHIGEPLAVLREAARILRDDGCLFLQVWPFYHSQFGSHLRDWFPDGWEHLEHSAGEIESIVRSSDLHSADWADVMLREFDELNKLTVDELGRALATAGFDVRRLNLLTRAVPLPPGSASRYALSALGTEGVELLAVPLER
jgi:SAM-dependent methyltransferase